MNILQQILILILGDNVSMPESPDNFSEKTKEILNRLKIKTPDLVQYLKLNEMKIKILLSGEIFFKEEERIEIKEKDGVIEIYYFSKNLSESEVGLIINCLRSENGIDTHFIYIAE